MTPDICSGEFKKLKRWNKIFKFYFTTAVDINT